jgi:hypothetical protein
VTTAYGYGYASSALQLIAGVNVVANGGTYVAPRIVAGTIDKDGISHPAAASATHPVIKPETAAKMRTLMSEVVCFGTAKLAKINGLTAAGKTGTGYKRQDNGTYLKDDGPVRIRDIWKNHTHAHPLRVEGFTFEGPMFPGTVAQRVGLPDMNYFLIGDDTDYAIRCKPHYQVFYIPTALATRQLPEKTEGSITLKDYYLIRNAYTFMALKYGVFPSKYIRPIVRCLAFARNRFVLHKVPITLSGLALLLRGIIDGYLGRLGRIN